MSHTAGITGSDEYGYEEPLPTIEKALETRNIELKRTPGIEFEYSEFAGLGICQLVIEDVTGQKFENYMVEHVFNKLGMNHTDYANITNDRGVLATPYAGKNKAIEVTPIVMNGGGGSINYINRFGQIWNCINRILSQLVIEPQSKNGIVIVTNSDNAYYLTYALMEQWSKNTLGEAVRDSQMVFIQNQVYMVITVLLLLFLVVIIIFVINIKKGKLVWEPQKHYLRIVCILTLIVITGMFYYMFFYTDRVGRP